MMVFVKPSAFTCYVLWAFNLKASQIFLFFSFFFPPLSNVLSFWHETVSRWKQLLQICHRVPSATRVMCQHWLQKISILISDYTLRRGWWTVFPLIVTHLLIITIWCDLSPFSKEGPSFVQTLQKRSGVLPVLFGEFWFLCGQLCFSKGSNQKIIVHLRGTITSLPSVPLLRNCLFLVIYNRPILLGTFAVEQRHTCTRPNPSDLCENETAYAPTFPQLALALYPWMDSFSWSLIFFVVLLIFRGQLDRMVSSPPSAFHQQHPKRSCDVSPMHWKMRNHSSLMGDPHPQTLGLSAGRRWRWFLLARLLPPSWVVWLRLFFPPFVILERCSLLSSPCGLFPESTCLREAPVQTNGPTSASASGID